MSITPSTKRWGTSLAVVLLAVGLSACSSSPSHISFNPPTSAPPVSSTAPSLPENPMLANDPAVVNIVGDLSLPQLPDGTIDKIKVAKGQDITQVANLQKLADDLASGNLDGIVANCWKQPPSELRLVYGSPSMASAILQALAETPQAGEYGAVWSSDVIVSVDWFDLESPLATYACPSIQWGDDGPVLGSFTPAMAHQQMTRILAAHDNSPLNPLDKDDFGLLCDDQCTGAWMPHAESYYSDDDALAAPIINATPAQWEALRALSNAQIIVEELESGFYRVRATDQTTNALAYFTTGATEIWPLYALGEIA